MKYRLEFWLLLLFRKILLCFSEKKRFQFGNFLGKIAYKTIASRRQTALWNLQLAFPEKSIEELEKIALSSFQIMIKYFLSTLWYEDYLPKHVRVMQPGHIQNIYQKGNGVMVALIHMGNMESAVQAGKNLPVVTVAKDQRNPYIDEFIIKNREEHLGIEILIKSKQTVRQLQTYIQSEQKYVYALFSDHRDKGATVSFFGLETVAPTGAVNLAYKYNIPLILVYSCMTEENSSEIYVSEEIPLVKTENTKQDILTNTQNLIYRMETIIRQHPEQWMWFHDRWNLYRNYKKEGIFPPFLNK